MTKLERFDYLQAESARLRTIQRTLHPLSVEWLQLERQIIGCFMLQAEA